MRLGDSAAAKAGIYGHNMLLGIADHHALRQSAYQTARYYVMHGGEYPEALGVDALAAFDRGVYELLAAHTTLHLDQAPTEGAAMTLKAYVNSVGRLHLRRIDDPRVNYAPNDDFRDVGFINLSQTLCDELQTRLQARHEGEAEAMARLKSALDAVHAAGHLQRLLAGVVDHVQHVESVCFFVEDRFLAHIDRFGNLVDSKSGPGYLSSLSAEQYNQWPDESVLVVGALHALFTSGRSVRFEQFNGTALTAVALFAYFERLLGEYGSVVPEGGWITVDAFDLAQRVRDGAESGVGQPWLRYRWIYALSFQKVEHVLQGIQELEPEADYLTEFRQDHIDLFGLVPEPQLTEKRFFKGLAQACLARDLTGARFCRPGSAATSWVEYLMERIVTSAALATDSDYGMSSSLRDIATLATDCSVTLLDRLHAFDPKDFFTCYVSCGTVAEFGDEQAKAIATSVQKRMMFNRWHFIPGNFPRPDISSERHWYYPPLVPDIAVHSDMHRAAHAKAMVKYSVRAPGPDMSRPPLMVTGRPYRGFYDVRVVRMDGKPFSPEEMLAVRRRTLWLEQVYDVMVAYIERDREMPLVIRGFQPGQFLECMPQASHEGDSGAASFAASAAMPLVA